MLKSVIHLIAIGTMGGIILAMMARVSLGHTGRALIPTKSVSFGLALILVAALIRGLLPAIAPELTLISFKLSAAIWILSFILFLWGYTPILLSPRKNN